MGQKWPWMWSENGSLTWFDQLSVGFGSGSVTGLTIIKWKLKKLVLEPKSSRRINGYKLTLAAINALLKRRHSMWRKWRCDFLWKCYYSLRSWGHLEKTAPASGETKCLLSPKSYSSYFLIPALQQVGPLALLLVLRLSWVEPKQVFLWSGAL